MLLITLVLSNAALGQAVSGQCGYDRWPVKILADKDRARVDLSPVAITVAKLAAIPIHEIPYPNDRRIAPEELHVYRVRARLIRVQREKDSDLHLLLVDLDEPDKHMIAEVPAPECAVGTGHEQEYRAAREMLTSIPLEGEVEVVGVGFFDFLHEQRGVAKNGIELHPVLRVAMDKPTVSGDARDQAVPQQASTAPAVTSTAGSTDRHATISKTGNDLLPECKTAIKVGEGTGSADEVVLASRCLSYIEGVWDANSLDLLAGQLLPKMGFVAPDRKGPFCVSEGVTKGQIIRIAVKWMEDHPEELALPGAAILKLSLREAFPCKSEAPLK